MARIDAVVGPTRARPAKKSPIAPTVEIAASAASQPQPAAVSSPGRRSPSAAEPTVSATAAPVHTSAARTCGRTRRAMPSLTRMYTA